MSVIQSNRKRNRSTDVDFHCQSKYFVNQRMVDSLDQKYMKTVFDKTMGLLFKGAKNVSNNNQLVESKQEKFRTIRLDGEGNVRFTDSSAGSSDRFECMGCNKMSTVQSECSNCNLGLCEYCGVSCVNCLEAHICKQCVQLFENNVNNLPCCRTCKMFT